MIIRNFGRAYQVIRHLNGTKNTEELLCRELSDSSDAVFLLVRIADLTLAKNFTVFLEEKIRGNAFTDYQECFQFEGAFYAVFRYSNHQTLAEKLSGEVCSLKERANIARGILEWLLLLEAHPFFAWNMLLPENITVGHDLTIQCRHHLENIEQADVFRMEDVWKRLYGILEYIFSRETEKKLYSELEEYFSYLKEANRENYLDMYQKFMPVFAVLTQENKEEPVPKTFWFHLWERMKKGLVWGRKILMAAILLFTIWYVIDVLSDNSSMQTAGQAMKQIGELIIIE